MCVNLMSLVHDLSFLSQILSIVPGLASQYPSPLIECYLHVLSAQPLVPVRTVNH